MAKSHSQYICQKCGYSQVGWAGKCPNCGTWGSLIETMISTPSLKACKRSINREESKIIKFSDIKLKSNNRISTKISELDRVLGGGLVAGQVVLLAGERGIGKSKILLQVADFMANTLYISGEESASQIATRAGRLSIKNKNIEILEETDVDSITALNIKGKLLLIVDSIQTLTTTDLSGMAGSVGQVRECASRLIHFAKSNNVPLFIVGQVTKEGTVAGPQSLAHLVDTVLWFEGEKSLSLRILRTVKNRFGPTDEVGIFEMEEKGLISQTDPEKLFITSTGSAVPGSVTTCLMHGNRPILVEIQSLVVPTKLPIPRRVAQGIDRSRFELLLAVLQKKCNLPLYEYDCFVNVAGGIRVFEPASDLAMCLSIASSFFDKAIPKNFLAIGEVGLLGEIREVVGEDKRVKQAKRLGDSGIFSNKDTKFLQQVVHKFLK